MFVFLLCFVLLLFFLPPPFFLFVRDTKQEQTFQLSLSGTLETACEPKACHARLQVTCASSQPPRPLSHRGSGWAMAGEHMRRWRTLQLGNLLAVCALNPPTHIYIYIYIHVLTYRSTHSLTFCKVSGVTFLRFTLYRHLYVHPLGYQIHKHETHRYNL